MEFPLQSASKNLITKESAQSIAQSLFRIAATLALPDDLDGTIGIGLRETTDGFVFSVLEVNEQGTEINSNIAFACDALESLDSSMIPLVCSALDIPKKPIVQNGKVLPSLIVTRDGRIIHSM